MVEGNESKALELVKKSCSESDPMSCYGVYVSTKADSTDKSMAASVLEEVCDREPFKDQTCCTCYLETKRAPAHDAGRE